MITNCLKSRRALVCSTLAGALAVLAAGCSGRTQTAQQALDQQYKDNPQLQRLSLAKFTGTVTVDGLPPKKGTAIVVMLNDPKKPSPANNPSLYTIAAPDGSFEFSTGLKGDGTKPGSYIVTFAQLHPHGRRGFFPPDELKDLYNDPDKNAEKPEFHVELTPPGRTDYQFNLKVAGETPVEKPGPKATTRVQ